MSTSENPLLPSLDEICQKTLERFGKRPCQLQVKVCLALLERKKHIICSASTGFGKTLTFMMPLIFDTDGVIIVIIALNVLGTQNIKVLESVGIDGIAINGTTNMVVNFQVWLLLTVLICNIHRTVPYCRKSRLGHIGSLLSAQKY